MCKRKIIRPTSEEIVPLLNGCDCPMVREFRHINAADDKADLVKVRKVYRMPPGCYDIHTQVPIPEVPAHHVVFRHCECFHFTGLCLKLPPLLMVFDENEDPDFDHPDNFSDDDADDDEKYNDIDGNIGIRPRL